MKKIVFATNNLHKLEEIRQILGSSMEVVSLADIANTIMDEVAGNTNNCKFTNQLDDVETFHRSRLYAYLLAREKYTGKISYIDYCINFGGENAKRYGPYNKRIAAMKVATSFMGRVPELVAAVKTLDIELSDSEAAALGLAPGENSLDGEQALAYVRLKLESDTERNTRGYDALMQIMRQGVGSGNLISMVGMGTKLLSSVDTNLGALTAVTLATSVQGGSDRGELVLPEEEQVLTQEPLTVDLAAVSERLHEEIYP